MNAQLQERAISRSTDQPVDAHFSSRNAVLSAAGIAVLAWVALAAQFDAIAEINGTVVGSLGIMSRFFTIWTNLLVAIVFTAIVLSVGRAISPRIVGGTVLAIVLVGIIYRLLLRGLVELSGGSAYADVLLHVVTPFLVPLYWLAFAPKGRLRWGDPLLFAAYPLVYLVYALVRGAIERRSAYPFLDGARFGQGTVVLNIGLIAIGFLLAAFALVALDGFLGRVTHAAAERDRQEREARRR